LAETGREGIDFSTGELFCWRIELYT
jgi:hypothetical protein